VLLIVSREFGTQKKGFFMDVVIIPIASVATAAGAFFLPVFSISNLSIEGVTAS